MNNFTKSILAGLAAGLIAGLIWGGLAYGIGRELGFIAWGVGALVGIAVRFMSGGEDGPKFGIVAILIAVASIFLGKFFCVLLIENRIKNAGNEVLNETEFDEEDGIEDLYKNVADEWLAKKKQVYVNGDAKGKQYTPAVKNEAKKRWKALPKEEQDKIIANLKAKLKEGITRLENKATAGLFAKMFSPYDLIWFPLAALSAFKLGSGVVTTQHE
jgi:hypothetical protein